MSTMFTPESLASGSPLLKQGNENNSSDLFISDAQKCCLRQLLNDCDLAPTSERISIVGLFKNARQFMTNGELRPKAMRLILGIIHDNRSKRGLYDLLMAEGTQLDALLAEIVKEEQTTVGTILAALAMETGQLPLPAPPILVRTCERQKEGKLLEALMRRFIAVGKEENLKIADCLASMLCEYPATEVQARINLVDNLEEADDQVDRLWERAVDKDSLPSLFLLFRLLQGSKAVRLRLSTTTTGPSKIISIVAKLKAALTERGRFPYAYIYLCIIHVAFAPENGDDHWPLVEALSKPKASNQESSWWALLIGTNGSVPPINTVLVDLLHFWRENAKLRRDKYVGEMLAVIVSIILQGAKQVPESILSELEDCLENGPHEDYIRYWLSLFQQTDESLSMRLTARYPRLQAVKIPPYEPVRFHLEPDSTSVAFFIPLLQAELHQHYSNAIKKSLGL